MRPHSHTIISAATARSSLSAERQQKIAQKVRLSLQRREGVTSDKPAASAPPVKRSPAAPLLNSTVALKANPLQVMWRIFIWLTCGLYFCTGTALDMLRRMDSQARRAVRLRRAFERAGGTAVKIGQQLSMRLDLLPYAYCAELAKLLDTVKPIDYSQAVEVIERTTGRPLEALFAALEPEPVGSASIACVFKGVLKDSGAQVAVKVRRPGITAAFAADLGALDILFGLAEGLTLLRPGFSMNLRQELRAVLTAELDFRREARFQEIFGRGVRRLKGIPVDVPDIYWELSGEELLVQEYVTGVWLTEILPAVETQDAQALARFRAMGIDPDLIAKHILHVDYWSLYESLVFHADPHPANLLVRPGGELVFVDFGACGLLDHARRNQLYQFLRFQAAENVWGMTQVFLTLMEPLPAVDVNVLAREIEAIFYNQMLAFKSHYSHWYERTSAGMWLSLLSLMNRYKAPVPLDVLLFVRATLLYDTLALRLSPQLNLFAEFQTYAKNLQKQSQKRILKHMKKRLEHGFQAQDFETLERLLETGNSALHRLHRVLALPYDFGVAPFAIEKGIFMVQIFLRFVRICVILTAAGLLLNMLPQLSVTEELDPGTLLRDFFTSPWYIVCVLIVAFFYFRRLNFRLQDKVRV